MDKIRMLKIRLKWSRKQWKDASIVPCWRVRMDGWEGVHFIIVVIPSTVSWDLIFITIPLNFYWYDPEKERPER